MRLWRVSRRHLSGQRYLCWACSTCAVFLACHEDALAQLDDRWTVTVNGQSVQVRPDGTFLIPNVSAADAFGPGGPGSPPDSLSDDFLRLTGTATVDGLTKWVFTDPFQIGAGEALFVQDLVVSDTPAPLPQSIRNEPGPALLELGESVQLTVMATLADGSEQDITPRTSWTVYRTSNAGVATVGPNGLVTANGIGRAFITAENGGITAVKRLDVAESLQAAVVEGFAHLSDGTPAEGADITILPFAAKAQTLDTGHFSLTLTVPQGQPLTVRARALVSGNYYAGVKHVTPTPAGITDVGIITVLPPASTNWALFPAPEFAVGHDPQAVAITDLDNDGDLDAVAATGSGISSIEVLLNSGDGSIAHGAVYSSNKFTSDIVSADLDNDGDADVAAARYYYPESSVSVMLNNGAGDLTVSGEYHCASNPVALTATDLDGDGDTDIAAAINMAADQPSVAIFFNNGDGFFSSPVTYSFGGFFPEDIVAADLDNDGDMDLATSNPLADNVAIMLNAGDGTFASPVTYWAGANPRPILSADVDGDGDIDLAVTNLGPTPTASVLLNNGNATFGALVSYSVGTGPLSITSGDFDFDGDLDLAIGNRSSDSVSLLLNNGNGLFNDRFDYVAPDPGSVTSVDMDLDGDVDLVGVVDTNADIGHLFILSNDGDGSFPPGSLSYPAGNEPRDLAMSDVDADGDADVVTINYLGDNAAILFNSGEGTFAPPVMYPIQNAPCSLALADIDGDSQNDIVATGSNTIVVLSNNGDGSFVGSVPIDVGSAIGCEIIAADLDVDGDIDVATIGGGDFEDVVVILWNLGSGSFGSPVPYAVGYCPVRLTGADVDGDGDIDLVATDGCSTAIALLPNNGDATFAAAVEFVISDDFAGLGSVASGDVDGDGDVDVLAWCSSCGLAFTSGVAVLLNSGSGVFTAASVYGRGVGAGEFAMADLNGDGAIDVSGADEFGDNVWVLLGNGDGTFRDGVGFASGRRPKTVIAGDVDGDGDIDLMSANSFGDNVTVLQNLSVR